MEAPRNKLEMYRMFKDGVFGNRLRFWENYEALEASGYSGLVGIRSDEGGGKFARYHIPRASVWREVMKLSGLGANIHRLRFGESASDDDLTIQGEVHRHFLHIEGFFSTLPTQMRPGLDKGGFHLYGLMAEMALKRHFTESSYEDLQAIFDMFPSAIVEFSCYRYCVGNIPGRNTVVWEVRGY